MNSTDTRVRYYLNSGDLAGLFVEELGWDRHHQVLPLAVGSQTITLRAIAHKRGMVAYRCPPDPDGLIPSFPLRRAIEQSLDRVVREHLIIFTDQQQQTLLLMWVRRAPGEPVTPREYAFARGSRGDALIQRIRALSFSLEEEHDLTLTDVVKRARAALDVDRVTKQFYRGYATEHQGFGRAIIGLDDDPTRRWYASVMLNRLMFAYFIQQKELLDGDRHYLRHRLESSMRRSQDRFYRDFLRPLFFDGLGKPQQQRPLGIAQQIGNVPYLNGGLFLPHRIEREYGDRLEVPDTAFAGPLDFFDRYQWHLDTRPGQSDSEIDPEVLGYIFEQFVNTKQMGAYYTKEDITRYIATSSIVPALFDTMAQSAPPGAAPVQLAKLLAADPDRYLFADARKGLDLALPPAIACGGDDPQLRQNWNAPADEPHAITGEIWRETVARRERVAALRHQLARGEIVSINQCLTANLDLQSIAQDVIASAHTPEQVLAWWTQITRLSVLDPTCGSGAFLFAALHVLQPLYTGCLERMAVVVSDGARTGAQPAATAALQRVLAALDEHPNTEYFVLKMIIVNNLYGVDIMEEAVEICKLRLFLKLAAQIERDDSQPNMGAEPLPDIDFHIRTGNALVGYASIHEAYQSLSYTLDGQLRLKTEETGERIGDRLQQVNAAFEQFHLAQLAPQVSAPRKETIEGYLAGLDRELSRALALEYGIRFDDIRRFVHWQTTHAPFHWCTAFYSIVQQRGGFDVVIGNPPYIGYPKVRETYSVQSYRTLACANLYAFAIERSLNLLKEGGRYGMIVPIAALATDGMREVQRLYEPHHQWHSHWAVRPGKLFVGVDMNLTISLLQKHDGLPQRYTTGYRRWSNGSQSDRPHLFSTIAYTACPPLADHASAYPKLGSALEAELLQRMLAHGRKLRSYTATGGTPMYYHSGGRYWRKALPTKLSSHYKPVVAQRGIAPVVFALLNSQLFYWYWIAHSNCMDVVSREVLELPVFALERADVQRFAVLQAALLESYYANSQTRARQGERIATEELNFDVSRAKPIIDEIDVLLADGYGFSAAELDFVLNYDVKYRMRGDERE